MPSSHASIQHHRRSAQPHQHHYHQSPAISPPASIPDTRLGLSTEDIATLRQHQQLAHAAQARSPAPSSSQASSRGGRLLLDPTSLQALETHFNHVMSALATRLDQLHHATSLATSSHQSRTNNTLQLADREILRFRALLAQIDEVELELEKIGRVGEIVRGWRGRVEGLERRIG